MRCHHSKLFFGYLVMGKLATVRPKNWSPKFSYLIYLSFTPPSVQFALKHIDYIGGATFFPVASNVAAHFLIEYIPNSLAEIPIDANSLLFD